MAFQPFFSVCIPAYHAEKYIRETLDSVAGQTWSHWEIVVVEDGSKDDTESIVRDFAATVSQKVRYKWQEKNAGLPATRNVIAGLASQTSDWFACLDADDLWLPGHLEDFTKVINEKKANTGEGESVPCGIVFAGCVIFDSDSGATIEHRTPSPENWRDFPLSMHRGEVIIQPSSVAISRAAWELTGEFDTNFNQCNDMEYWFRACRRGVKFIFTGNETLHYRKHAGAMSNRSAELIAEIGKVQFRHREWKVIPAAQRRREIRKNYLNAARIDRRAKPLLALKEVACAILLPLLVIA